MNDEGAKYGEAKIRTYHPSGRVTDKKHVQHRTKQGKNPAGLQHKETGSTPGGPKCNGGNPMVKRGMSVADVRRVVEEPRLEGMGEKLAEELAPAIDPATRIPGEDPKKRLKRQAVAYAHEGLQARRKLEAHYQNRALRNG